MKPKNNYYKNDRQLGLDLIKLGYILENKHSAAAKIPGACYESAIKLSREIIRKIEGSRSSQVKLAIFSYIGNKNINRQEIIVIAICLLANCSNGGERYATINNIMQEIKALCNNSPKELIKYLKIVSEDSWLVKSGLCRYHYNNIYITKSVVRELIGMRIKKPAQKKSKLNNPSRIKKTLDRVVIGQERAKQVISLAAYSYLKVAHNKKQQGFPNILMIGPTGSGKTHIIRSLAEILDMPITITDATQYSETGYVGGDVMDIMYRIQREMKKKEDCDSGIIYIDEIDKIAGEVDYKREVSARAVQEELLKILDKKVVTGKAHAGGISAASNEVNIDTSKLMIVCGGAFSGLNISENVCGFNANNNIDNRNITNEVLIQYGMIPELLGRLPVRVFLDELSVEDLVNILKSPVVSPINEFKGFIPEDMITSILSERILREIACKAIKLGIGARGLVTVLEEYLAPVIYREDLKIG